jgi:adenine-specific DNA-methyltransferase
MGEIMIKYLGSKRTLLSWIGQSIQKIPDVRSVIDLFSGTSRVGHHMKGGGYQVHSNDLNTYAHTLATCYVAANREDHIDALPGILAEMNALKPEPGYFTESFCVQSRFFQEHNGAKIDAMRTWVEEQGFSPERKAIVLVSLMEAADRVDSTCGIQMAYLKKWAARSYNDLTLRIPNLLSESSFGKGSASNLDAFDAAKKLSADVAYLDPPYNQHKYLGNYHIWESLVRWDKPEFYGVACKRVDVRERASPFNRKRQIQAAMKGVIEQLDVDHILVSFNNEGYISKEDMIELLSARGEVLALENTYKRYVGAQIGIHNPKGKKVGTVSHLKNKEYLFVVTKNSAVLQCLAKEQGD